jgi:hypothetical protein
MMLAVGVAAGVLLGGLAAPAYAGSVTEVCGNAIQWVELQAHYEPVYIDGAHGGEFPIGKEWTHFTYRLGYTGGVGDQNNVNIRIYSGGRKIYEYKSPDNRTNDRWYGVVLTPTIVTLNFVENSIGFEGIFDYAGWPDRLIFCRIEPV